MKHKVYELGITTRELGKVGNAWDTDSVCTTYAIVLAETEVLARRLFSEGSDVGAEGREVWLDREKTFCIDIVYLYESPIVINATQTY